MRLLEAAQVVRRLALKIEVGLAEEVLDQNGFRRDGGVGLEIELEMPVLVLRPQQRRRGARDRLLGAIVRRRAGGGLEIGRRIEGKEHQARISFLRIIRDRPLWPRSWFING